MNPGTRLNNYILFAVSFIAAIWFFVGYPSQDPRSVAELSFDKKEIELRSAEKLSELGFVISDYTLSEVLFRSNEALLDSLQHRLGRHRAIEMLKSRDHPNLKPFYWEVVFIRKGGQNNRQDEREPFRSDPDELRIHLDMDGSFVGLANANEHLPQQKVHRSALGAVFTGASDSLHPAEMPSVSDSLMSRLLYFDMQKEDGSYSEYQRRSAAEISKNLSRGIPYRHSANDARAIAEYYLAKTGWDISSFRVDTFFVKRIGSVNAANIRYQAESARFEQQSQLDVVVSPTGALLQMNASYNPTQAQNGSSNFVWAFIHTILIFGLILAGLIIFFFRMRSRAIDTQSALVVAVIMGLAVPISYFLQQINAANPFSETASFNESLILFLQMGIYGALSSVGFFVLFAISDSITRQHWPEKLSSYDYLRQGMIFNKPVGIVLLRAIGLAFVLAGFWTLAMWVLPQVYFSYSTVFLSEKAAWPPLYMLLKNSWFSFAIILGIFLVIGSQTYGRSDNKWFVVFFTILASGIIVPLYQSFGPPVYEMLLGALIGVALIFIYLRWDFLTVLLTHFLFLGLLGSASGWVIPDSPDTSSFILFTVFLLLLTVLAGFAIFMGKEERSLPNYVPTYVEELAQEERIKQELQIAREVQQSFLPSKIPAVAGLDVAAVCRPAYETGGDYYDFIQLDDHRVAVAIGDVSGKGIQAAFYMTFVKGMLHSLCRETNSPAKVLSKANRLFYDNAARGTFISLIYGVIDMRENTFTFARAGHNPILHLKISSGETEELQPNGLGLGLTRAEVFDNKIREIELSITEDDLFLLYTDGIVEALNQQHQFYGTKKLKTLIKQQKHNRSSEIVAATSDGVTRFIGKAKQHDDMTLMAIRFGNKAG